MVTFDCSETAEALKRRKLYGRITIAYISALVFFAVLLAALSGYAEKNWNLYIAFLCTYSLALLSFILFLIFFGARANRELCFIVCKTVAAAFYANEDILKGGNICFTVSYSGDILTVSRDGYTHEIIIRPASFKDGRTVADGGAQIEFDLSALKAAPSVYSSAGEKLLLFLQAYYLKNAQKLNVGAASVTDATGSAPLKIILVEEGRPIAANDNYFIKRGLIND